MAQHSSVSKILASLILVTATFLTHAQSPQAKPSFEVAAIRPSKPDPTYSGYDVSPAGILSVRSLTAKELISTAYNVKDSQISGGPNWASSTNFDIDAKIDETLIASLNKLPRDERNAQINIMLQSLLAERFKLQIRHETKTLSAYALVVAKGGAKLKPSPPSTTPQQAMLNMSGHQWTLHFMTMKLWADHLSGQPDIGRPVSDETGLSGTYEFVFNWTPSSDGTGPNIFTALSEQLGLRLEPRKSSLDTIVIEHIEPLTEN